MESPSSGPGRRAFAVAAAAGLAAGVVLGRMGAAERPSPAPPPASPPAPPASPPPAAVPVDPGPPPPGIRPMLEEAVVAALRGGAPGPGEGEAREEAWARVKAGVSLWEAETTRSPLAATGWWREALRRTMVPAAPEAPGLAAGAIRWGGRPYPVLYHAPAGPGPHPAVLALLGGEPEAEIRGKWGDLLATHLVIGVPCRGIVAEDPRMALLAIPEAARRWGLDRDRVVLDATGYAAAKAAAIAPAEAHRLAGVVLRGPVLPGEPAENLAAVPLLGLLPAGGGGEAARSREALRRACPAAEFPEGPGEAGVQEWVRALPPRRSADPRNPVAWAAITGEGYRPWGPGFLVRALREDAPGTPVRVALARDPERNAVVLRTENVAGLALLLNDEGLDLDRPVEIFANGKRLEPRRAERRLETLRTWALQEPGLLVTAELDLRIPE